MSSDPRGLGVVYAAWGYGPGVVFSVEVRGNADGAPYSIALDAAGATYVAETVSSTAAACYARLVGDTVNAIAVDAEGDAWIGGATTGAVVDYR